MAYFSNTSAFSTYSFPLSPANPGLDSLFYASMAASNYDSGFGSVFSSPYSSGSFDSGSFGNFDFGSLWKFGSDSLDNYNPFSFMGFNPFMFRPYGRTRSHNKGEATYKPLSNNCLKQINNMSSELKMDPKDIQAMIYAESSGNPKAVNPISDATGLIQWLPSTAERFGTTTDKLYNMTAEQQMPYVKAYLKTAKSDAGFKDTDNIDAGTLYALVVGPANAKKDVIYTTSDGKRYRQNAGLDLDGNGKITKTELGTILNKMKKSYKIS